MKGKLGGVTAAAVIFGFFVVWFFHSTFKIENYDSVIMVGETKIHVELAQSPLEKYQGLSGRESMCTNCGMVFLFDEPYQQHFIMRGMKFALDFVFIRSGEVVEIYENIPPPKDGKDPENVISKQASDTVLELNSGFVSEYNLQVGDAVSH